MEPTQKPINTAGLGGVCAPWPGPAQYPDSIRLFGEGNVEEALILIERTTDPRTGLAIALPSDDQSVSDVLRAVFSALKRQELNSEGFEAKLSEAISTCLYTFQLPVILHTDGTYTVGLDSIQGERYRGDAWGLVHWVRNAETTMIEDQARGQA